MSRILFIVNNPGRWPLQVPGVELVSARSYLTDPDFSNLRQCRVFNLCRSYRYQSLGYYVSLLAEARGHRPVPSVTTIQDLRSPSLVRVVSEELDALIQKSMGRLQGDRFTLSVYFGRNLAKQHDSLCRHLFNLFPMPLLRAGFHRSEDGWEMRSLNAIPASDVPEEHRPFLVETATEYFMNHGRRRVRRKAPRYYMAILVNDKEKTPPSDPAALEQFVSAAADLGIAADLIDREDYGALGEYDALFIRETTAVDNPTYRFARRAEADGLVVMDDPQSIVRCTNKVFLAELLARRGVATPKTRVLHRDNFEDVLRELGLPCILKRPDSSFSQGVVKAGNEEEFRRLAEELLEDSELLIAQEFVRTDFDWRIGVLDRKPLYACRYFMARGHWQIYDHSQTGDANSGDFETLSLEMVPRSVVTTAVRAANLIGDGLYGVDLKSLGRRVSVIEVNDNPSIDSGVEDQVLGRDLYRRIMASFLRRLEEQRQYPSR